MEFINVTYAELACSRDITSVVDTNRRRVRIHVMKDFRRKEHEQRMAGTYVRDAYRD